ncbi:MULTISPECIES: dihydrolipoyl dehydrogenase [Hyphomonas]|uniref:Dihydrolipoyl dehydrogenase n=3 Tax=Hyphomonas atlantica TaxID=1280948 RepID=A0A059DX51_9PROT|nr:MULTISPECIES: dihydrolipoyl dehydrogenase [Hyphomonas]KCZ58022.1 dihydrolipoamide dehydrogenase [Hyphomonas atlantica]MAM07838.1 dihydrolipoyl dehydrogenase [Hyphomonas sp.]
MSTQYDLIVIGSGPGGYVSAIRASQLGMKTAIVERESLGGICLNWGCIPTKALLRSAEVLHLAKHAKDFGLKIDKADFDLDAVVKRSRGVANQLSSGVKFLMKKNKIDVIEGTARLEKGEPAPKVIVKDKDGKVTSYQAKHVMLATGARARDIPQAGLVADKKLIWTYREAMTPDVMPKRLLVIGSGAIGIEFASFYHELGADVTVAEVMDRILPVEDEEISKLAEKDFKKQGLNIVTGAKVENLTAGKTTVTAEITDKSGQKQKQEFDRAILAVGIVGNVENLGLEALGVKVEKTHVKVDNFGRTGVKGLYAIGDLTGPPWLAHKASHEGVVCVEGIAGANHAEPFDPWNVPGCTYAHPQVASVGLTEKAAKEKGYEIKVGRFPFIGNGKAIAMGASEGLVKTIFDKKTGELLGAHMIGAEVTELIQGYVIARQGELTEQDLAHTIFPHPTISESMHESVLDAEGRVIHI